MRMSMECRKVCRSCDKHGLQYDQHEIEKLSFLYFSNDLSQAIQYIKDQVTFDRIYSTNLKQRKNLSYTVEEINAIDWCAYDDVMAFIEIDFPVNDFDRLIKLLSYERPVIRNAMAIAKSKGIYSIAYILACCPIEQKKFHKKLVIYDKIEATQEATMAKVEFADLTNFKEEWGGFKEEENNGNNSG